MRSESFELRSFLNLIRALFPKWSFFDESGHLFYLEVKAVGSDVWTNLKEDQERSAFGLFFNPSTNLSHAFDTLIQQFVFDLQDLLEADATPDEATLENMATYKMVRSLALRDLQNTDFKFGSFQFRISAHRDGVVENVFVSNVISSRSV